MARPTRIPPDRWIEEGLRALAAGGPDAVRVEVLARELGVTKGGFYNHFDDRPALLGEMLQAWERLVVDQVIERLEAEGGDARSRLRGLFALGSSSVGDLMKVELAIRDWARRDRAVARRLKRIDNRRMDYLRSLFGELFSDEEEVEMRSLVALALFVGVPSTAADHRGRRRGDLYRKAWERLVDS
jgi:AcrR family transcriptional regulator